MTLVLDFIDRTPPCPPSTFLLPKQSVLPSPLAIPGWHLAWRHKRQRFHAPQGLCIGEVFLVFENINKLPWRTSYGGPLKRFEVPANPQESRKSASLSVLMKWFVRHPQTQVIIRPRFAPVPSEDGCRFEGCLLTVPLLHPDPKTIPLTRLTSRRNLLDESSSPRSLSRIAFMQQQFYPMSTWKFPIRT